MAIGERELGVLGGDREVGGEHEADAEAGDRAMHRGDDRQGEAAHCDDQRMRLVDAPLEGGALLGGRRAIALPNSRMSPPAMKPAPLPLSTTTRQARSPATRASAASSARPISPLTAFSTSGRLSVEPGDPVGDLDEYGLGHLHLPLIVASRPPSAARRLV